ncbi:MAG: gamma-glutamyltransferase family protein [Dehalococcoidia bacterium]
MARTKTAGLFYGAGEMTRRPPVMGLKGVVSSGHYLASQAGMRMLHAGGNAIDAGVAAGMCLNVLLPYLTNLGGVAPIIIYSARERRVTTISGLGRWPRSASIEAMKERGHGDMPNGILRAVTPAALDAWVMALERYGRLSFAEVAGPALELAQRGFAVDASLAGALAYLQDSLSSWPTTVDVFYRGGKAPAPGSVLVQRDLAATLQALMAAEKAGGAATREGRLRAVRDAFYKGDIARRMAEFSQKLRGFLTYDDLAEFEVREEPPVSADYKGYQVYACGPWCQGPTVPQTLKLLEGVDLAGMGHNSASYIHHVVEAIKLTYADRDRYYGDPDFEPVPMDALLSEVYARQRRQLIDPKRAWPEMPPAGDPTSGKAISGVAAGVASLTPHASEPQGDTSYVCVIDDEGNGFSATPSDFIGQCPIVPGLGLIISGRGTQSWLDPDHVASLKPWKRPRLTPNPGLVLRDGELFMAFGTPGGDQQPQGMVQAFLNVVEFGMSPQQAVEAPRFGTWSFPNSFWPHEYLPGRLNVEARVPSQTRKRLADLGHDVEPWRDLEPRCGHVCAILRDGETGVLHGGADPRFVSYAIAW